MLHELARVERYPFLSRFHGQSGSSVFWAFERDSVARGVAVGFFFGILTPVAQIVFAIVIALVLRANLVVAVGSTLITNPFMLPFIYYYAYRIGIFVTGRAAARDGDIVESEQAAENALDVGGWVPTLIDWISSVGFPLIVGIVLLALATSLLGYVCVHLAWSLSERLRGRRRA